MKACYQSQMKKIDLDATAIGGIPSIVLMENAGLSCVRELENEFDDLKNKSIAVFCGRGNNGGDGFVVARHLINMGIDTTVYLLCGDEFKGDCLVNYEILEKMNANIVEVIDSEIIELYIKTHDIVVDAIYGTGVRGSIDGIVSDVISAINKYSRYTMSIDIPSGINADTGEICGVCVNATKTVTFVSYKVGMLMFPGNDYVGDVVISDISVPKYIVENQDIKINVIDKSLAKKIFPKRDNNSQKGDYGKVFVIGGSTGMTGAAYLSSRAALVSGSGLVTLGIPEKLNSIMEQKLTEVMTLPLEDENGHLSFLCIDQIIQQMNKCDVVLFGPGLGNNGDIRNILEEILKQSQIPVIIDADGLNALSQNMDILISCNCNLILTPHSVEMSRLSQISLKNIENNRLQVSNKFVQENGVVLILKGHHTIVTALDGEQYINIRGNSGMATGGSGDVLAGMIASFVARGSDESLASVLAVYLHSLAGDIAKDKLGKDSLTAESIIDNIPYSIMSITD